MRKLASLSCKVEARDTFVCAISLDTMTSNGGDLLACKCWVASGCQWLPEMDQASACLHASLRVAFPLSMYEGTETPVQAKLKAFLALMPREAVEAARQQAALF